MGGRIVVRGIVKCVTRRTRGAGAILKSAHRSRTPFAFFTPMALAIGGQLLTEEAA